MNQYDAALGVLKVVLRDGEETGVFDGSVGASAGAGSRSGSDSGVGAASARSSASAGAGAGAAEKVGSGDDGDDDDYGDGEIGEERGPRRVQEAWLAKLGHWSEALSKVPTTIPYLHPTLIPNSRSGN